MNSRRTKEVSRASQLQTNSQVNNTHPLQFYSPHAYLPSSSWCSHFIIVYSLIHTTPWGIHIYKWMQNMFSKQRAETLLENIDIKFRKGDENFLIFFNINILAYTIYTIQFLLHICEWTYVCQVLHTKAMSMLIHFSFKMNYLCLDKHFSFVWVINFVHNNLMPEKVCHMTIHVQWAFACR